MLMQKISEHAVYSGIHSIPDTATCL